MVWARIDDNLDENEKQLALTDAEFRLWVCSWTWCSRHLSDGRITAVGAAALARKIGVRRQAIAGLVDKGCWERSGDGFVVHDFLDYNPRREKVLAEREGGRRRAADSYARARSSPEEHPKTQRTFGVSSPDPVPVTRNPVPSDASPPLKSPPPLPKASAEVRALTAFTEAWNANSGTLAKLDKPPAAKVNIALVLRAWQYFDDVERLSAAIRLCAADPDYRADHRTFATFCRHVEDRWGPRLQSAQAKAAPILPMASADDRARRRLAVSNAVREQLQAGMIPRPEDFDPIDRGYLDQALAENREVIWAMRHPELAVAR